MAVRSPYSKSTSSANNLYFGCYFILDSIAVSLSTVCELGDGNAIYFISALWMCHCVKCQGIFRDVSVGATICEVKLIVALH